MVIMAIEITNKSEELYSSDFYFGLVVVMLAV